MADVTSKDCKPCPDCLDGEEMGRTFMVAYRNALRDNSPRGNK